MPQFDTQDITGSNEYWAQRRAEAEALTSQRKSNIDRYGVSVPDGVYEQWNKAISMANDPESEAHRIGSAYQWSQILGVPLEDAYQNLDAYNQQFFGDVATDSKSAWKALKDMVVLGQNNVHLGDLGNKYRNAISRGDTEAAEALKREIDAYEADNELRQDNTPRSWLMEAFKAGAQSLPFTGYTVGAGLIGNFIAPGVGTAASFGTSAYLSAGQEYLDMIKNGSSHEVATGFSLVSGALQGAIEVALGNVAQSLSVGSKIAGQTVKESLSDAAVRKVTNAVGKAINLGPAGKVITQFVTRYGENVLEEGSEELLQEITSIVNKELAAQLDGYDIPDDSMSEIMTQLAESFKGGVYGALTLGILPTSVNVVTDVKEYQAIKQAAETIPSESTFKKAVADSPVFSEMDPYTKETVIDEIYQNAQSRRDAKIADAVKDVTEVNRAAEGFEDITEDEETGETNAAPVYRENGKLVTQNDVVSEADGTTKKIYKVGDVTAENADKNLYGYINHTVDENAKTVIIDDFVMNKYREGLREEMYQQFARDYAGYDIQWNPTGARALNIKNELIKRNPSGSNSGLNWYSNTSIDDETRTKLATAIRTYFKNITREELPAAVALFENMAKSAGVSISEFIDAEFGSSENVFGNVEDVENQANQEGKTFSGKEGMRKQAGATGWRVIGNDLKAVIYGGENADFSTLAHELNHAFLDYLKKLSDLYNAGNEKYADAADLLSRAEKAFNVQDHDWIKSQYTMADGHIESSAEALAYGFQDFLKTGNAQNEELKTFYQKLSEFMARCINSLKKFINLTPEINSVYESLLKGDGSELARAEEAVRKSDEEMAKTKPAEKVKETVDAETVMDETETAVPEYEEMPEDAAALMKESAANADEAFPLDEDEARAAASLQEVEDNQREKVDEVLTDAVGTESAQKYDDILDEQLVNQTDKKQVAVDAASEQMEVKHDALDSVFDDLPDMLFQIIGELGATQLDREEEVSTRMDNLSIAREMETAGKDAKTIRLATGWEKGVDGKWRYEIGDFKKLDVFGAAELKRKYPKYRRLTELEDKWFDDTITKDEQKELDELYATTVQPDYEAKQKKLANSELKLKDIINEDELFNAYPELKDVNIWFGKIEGDYATNGMYSPEENAIILFHTNPLSVAWADKHAKSTLVHEIQHAIQSIEGFAKGGSVDSVVQNYRNKIYDRMNEAYREYHTNEELKKDYDEYKKLFNKVANASEDEFMAAYDELFKFEESHENVTRFNKELEKARKDLNLEYNGTAAPLFNSRVTDTYYDREYDEIVKELTKQYYDIHAIDDYQALAGEVEARNVQKRFDMSSEERLNTLLADTEDVSRKDQILMYQAINNPSLLFQEENDRKINSLLVNQNPTQEVNDYINEYYIRLKDSYYTKSFTTQDGKITATIEVYKHRKDNPYEMDAAVILASKGNKVVVLKETGKKQGEKHPDFLVNNSVLVEVKGVTTDTARNIADEALSAINKGKENIPTIIYFENALNVNYQDVIDSLNKHNKDDFKYDNANILFIRDNNITVVEKDGAGVYKTYAPNAQPLPYFKIDRNDSIVNPSILFQKAYHGTSADFEKFDTENYGLSGEGSMSFGYGTYVSGSEEIARDYAIRQADDYSDPNDTYEEDLKTRHLYTVEIPDNGFIKWDGPITQKHLDIIAPYFVDEMEYEMANGDFKEEWPTFSESQKNTFRENWKKEITGLIERNSSGGYVVTGDSLYYGLYHSMQGFYGTVNKAQKAASRLLRKAGFTGIDYPAGTIYGDGKDARNYVIFDDSDVKIIDHLLFQTQQELYADASAYDSWQEFMEAYQMDFDPQTLEDVNYHSQVPQGADADWYKTTWELAHNLIPTESMTEDEVMQDYANEPASETAKDSMFMMKIEKAGELEKFLDRVIYINDIDFDSEEWSSPQDIDEQIEFEHMKDMQSFIQTQLRHASWLSNAKRVRGGKELTSRARQQMLSLIRGNVRDYRAVYSEIMEDDELKVPKGQTVSARIKRNPLSDPDRDYENMTPEQRRELADTLENRDIGRRIRKGDIKVSDDVNRYIKYLDDEIKDLQKQYKALETESKADMLKFSDAELRAIYKQQDKLIRAQHEIDKRDKQSQRMIEKGIRMTEKYQRDSKLLRSDYDSIYAQYQDLLSSVKLTEQLKARLTNRQKMADLKYDMEVKQADRAALSQIRQSMVKLIKRTMRRVPFERVDYDTAKTIIAIQRIFEPNLEGGINEWLGQDRMLLKVAATNWLTSDEEQKKLRDYFTKIDTPTAQKAIELFDSLTSSNGVKRWDEKTRKSIERILPKDNWVRNLELQQKEEERRKSIDLDIKVDTKTREVTNPINGKKEIETMYTVSFPDDIKNAVKEAVGDTIYSNLLNKPFRDWTVNEMEELAIKINDMYKYGKDALAAKVQLEREQAQAIRNAITNIVNDAGIEITDDDTPEEREAKQKKIAEILGLSSDIKGTSASQLKKETRINRLLHGYSDATLRRVANILDGNRDGMNVNELYFKEDECYNNKHRSIRGRTDKIKRVMKEVGLTPIDLNRKVMVDGREYTVDELLYFYAADRDYQTDAVAYSKHPELDDDNLLVNDNFAPSSRNAVMFGNMLSANEDQALKESLDAEDKDLKKRLEGNELTAEELQDLNAHILDKMPGTTKFMNICRERYQAVLNAANELLNDEANFIDTKERGRINKYAAILNAISKDYADQYNRMNEISIKEFNMPLNRVQCYVPLVRLESNGDTNAAQVKQDLLTTMGSNAAGQAGVGKGMTKRRVSISPLHQKPVQTGLYKTWANSVERTEHFISYASYVRELNRVYKSRDAQYMRRFIENRYGKGMVAYLDDYINEVANPNANKVRSAGDDLIRSLRGKTAPAYLSWKLSSVLKQATTSPAPFMQFMTPKEYLKGAIECWNNNGFDTIKEKSVFMAERVQDPLYDLIDELSEGAKTKGEQALLDFSRKGMSGLEWIDWVCVAPGWMALYKRKYSELQKANPKLYEDEYAKIELEQRDIPIGSTYYLTDDQMKAQARNAMLTEAEMEQQAVQYADDLTRQCQPSSRAVDIAPLFKNSSEFAKAYLQFQTSLNVIWNNIRYDLPAAVKSKQFGRVVGMIAGYTVAGIMMNALMEGFTGGDGEDDDDEAIKNAVFYATTQFTDSVPLIGSYLTSTNQKLITGKGSVFGQNGTDMTPMVTKFGDATVEAFKGNWEKAAQKYAEGVSMNFGIPTSGVKELLKLFDVDVIDDKPTIELDNIGNIYGLFADFMPEDK